MGYLLRACYARWFPLSSSVENNRHMGIHNFILFLRGVKLGSCCPYFTLRKRGLDS